MKSTTPQPPQAAQDNETGESTHLAGTRRLARMIAEHPSPAGFAAGAGVIGLYTAQELARRQAKQEPAQKADPFTR